MAYWPIKNQGLLLRIHASYHKCLTMYFIKVMEHSFNKSLFGKKQRYHHFESIEGVFYNTNKKYKVSSTNGFAIDVSRLSEDFRITRFVRDPRDLVISGYFYHKRGAEPWFRMINPTNKYWEPINGNVPSSITSDQSYADYLSSVSVEEGLLAEIEFRKHHIESFRKWSDDERIKMFKYEDILGNEKKVFSEIADHYELTSQEKGRVVKFAQQFSLKNMSGQKHVRNPKPRQWKDHFTAKVNQYFNEKYSDILDSYNYEVSFS